jgi:cytochrome P450
MSLRETGRSFATWSFAHGLQRRALRTASRRGDLIARVTIDPALAADPFPAYEELRRRGPLPTSPVATATVHHAVADEVLRGEAFGTAAGHAELPAPVRRVLTRLADPWAASPVDPPSMLVVDPPDHTRYRRLVSRAFTARSVGGLQERVEAVSGRLLDRIGGDAFDVVESFAALLPVAVIADLLGVPAEEHGRLLEWGNRAAVTLDPGLTFREYRAAEEALRRMHRWFDGHVARLRREPGDDLLSRLAVLPDDEALTAEELRAVGLLVLGAGFETTVNLIGNAVVALDAHPDQLALLRAEPDRWGNAVEEVLRYDSPVQLTMRSAYADVRLESAGDAVVPAGQAVLVLLGGANRDPALFTDPAAFDVTRANAGQHLAFSAGIHFCLGASLARLEATTGLRALYERFPDLVVTGTPTRRPTRVLRGFAGVPVSTRRRVA